MALAFSGPQTPRFAGRLVRDKQVPSLHFVLLLMNVLIREPGNPCAELLERAAQLLYDTFSAFGMIIQTPKIMRDPETGASRGFGFVSYDSFEASDAAIEAMHGQYLCNRCAA